jgi:hypothetical protein
MPSKGQVRFSTGAMGKRAWSDRALSLPNTGMQWQCLPIPHDPNGQPAIHYTTVYKVFLRRNN